MLAPAHTRYKFLKLSFRKVIARTSISEKDYTHISFKTEYVNLIIKNDNEKYFSLGNRLSKI